jgi:hypothetical protein
MPKRRRDLRDSDSNAVWERAQDKVVQRYGWGPIHDAMNALNHGGGEQVFHEAMHAAESAADSSGDDKEFRKDFEMFERLYLAWLEPYLDQEIGRMQRAAGGMSPGRRGKYKVAPEKLLAEVLAMHARSPLLTFNDVCEKVATSNGYRSAYQAKKAAAAIQWPDPRRKQK